MHNVNPATGIRYGVISFNSLQPWCGDDLFHGDKAVDLSWEEAMAELQREAAGKYAELLEQCDTAMAEVDHWMSDHEKEKFTEKWFAENEARSDRDEFIDDYVERERDGIQIDEPIIEGEYDGVKYRISWLGGAPLLWVFEGPEGVANRLCSPCVPNAADLDGGFVLGDEMADDVDYSHHYACYCVPRSWLADE